MKIQLEKPISIEVQLKEFPISVKDLVENLIFENNDEAMNTMLALDDEIAEITFTYDLIKKLIESLLTDVGPEDIKKEIMPLLSDPNEPIMLNGRKYIPELT